MTEEGELIGENLAKVKTTNINKTGGGMTTKPLALERKTEPIGEKLQTKKKFACNASDSEEGFLSTSPDSANGETVLSRANPPTNLIPNATESTTRAIKLNESITPTTICICMNPSQCVTLKDILGYFKSALSEEHAWALIFQYMQMYRNCAASTKRYIFNEFEMPERIENLHLHPDGTVHCSSTELFASGLEGEDQENPLEQEVQQQQQQQQHAEDGRNGDEKYALMVASHKKILRKVAIIVYTALDYNLQADEQCQMSQELEELITYMTSDDNDDDCIDEGIDEGYKRWDDDDDKCNETKEFDHVLEACKIHVKPTVSEDHYKAVCRALVTETIELKIFLQQVLNDGADNLHLKADAQTSKQELAKLGFNDWARFWVQVIDELRRGIRLKKNKFERAPIEYELTPYEILMEDIRSKKYQLRKVMVNGDIPPRVKKDAHALILEFIRSRPPLKKASERKLPPPMKRNPSPREQLMDSIRQGQTLKHIQPPTPRRLKDRLLPPTVTSTSVASKSIIEASSHTLDSLQLKENMEPQQTHSKLRLIKVDFSLLQDDDTIFDEASSATQFNKTPLMAVCSQPKMPPYPIGGYMPSEPTVSALSTQSSTQKTMEATTSAAKIQTALHQRTLRRTNYDLATQCESRRASLRRHTIVGCQNNSEGTHSMPTSRPDSRQSDVQYVSDEMQKSTSSCGNENDPQSSKSLGPWNKSFFDEKTWKERGEDHLSLTLEEIVHIRSVITKAQLEGLPVGVRVREDVEKRKICFLCLRTRFWIFGPWGIQCKLCQRTVCSKCSTKMRIPSEHFRNVPLVLISPSLLASPAGSSTPSPSHHAKYMHSSSTGNILDETFPKSLIERLLRSESEQKTHYTVGSAPSSPKHQRSNMSTPGISAVSNAVATAVAGQAVEALHANVAMTSSYPAGNYSSRPEHSALANGKATQATQQLNNKHISIMSRSMEGPRSLPANSPARSIHSNSSTLDRKSKLSRAFALSSSGSYLNQADQKENLHGELVPVCNDCKGLVMEITRSSRHRSSARNRALKNMTLDLSPVYK